jgi:4-aminobutyrate aminotransferase and related aminotransferases
MDRMGRLASQFLFEEKVILSKKLVDANQKRFGLKGRVHFNVGGSQAIEDSLKLVRNYKKKNLNFAFMGGYHGRTLGATAITSSYRYRERFGHFSDRALFIPFPYCFRCPYGKNLDSCDYYCVKEFEKLFESEYYSIYNPRTKDCEYAAFYVELIQGTGGYVKAPPEYFKKLKKILDQANILLVDDEIQMGFYRTGKLWSIEHYGVKPDIIVFWKISYKWNESFIRTMGKRRAYQSKYMAAGFYSFYFLFKSDRCKSRLRSYEHHRRKRLRKHGSTKRAKVFRGLEKIKEKV